MMNNSVNTNIRREGEGVAAFYNWIYTSLQSGKPYNTMATELITATGANSYTQGELNFLPGSFQPGVPAQDTYDQSAVDTVRAFGAEVVLITVIVDRGGTCAQMAKDAGIEYVPVLTAPDLGFEFGS